MTHIKLFKSGKGCQVPANGDYLMVTSHEVDNQGNWVPSKVQSFRTFRQLKTGIRGIAADGESIVIQASDHFRKLASDLGLLHLTSEWGNLSFATSLEQIGGAV